MKNLSKQDLIDFIEYRSEWDSRLKYNLYQFLHERESERSLEISSNHIAILETKGQEDIAELDRLSKAFNDSIDLQEKGKLAEEIINIRNIITNRYKTFQKELKTIDKKIDYLRSKMNENT